MNGEPTEIAPRAPRPRAHMLRQFGNGKAKKKGNDCKNFNILKPGRVPNYWALAPLLGGHSYEAT